MVHGFTDTECRIAEFRYQGLLAEADRQRRGASAAPAAVPAGQAHVMETIHHHITALTAQFCRLLAGGRAHGAADPVGAHATVVVN